MLLSHQASTMFFYVSRSRTCSAAYSRVRHTLSRMLRSTSFPHVRCLLNGLLSSIAAYIILFTCLSSPIILTSPNHLILSLFNFKVSRTLVVGVGRLPLKSTFLKLQYLLSPSMLLTIRNLNVSSLLSSVSISDHVVSPYKSPGNRTALK